jgi:hypothetical protein
MQGLNTSWLVATGMFLADVETPDPQREWLLAGSTDGLQACQAELRNVHVEMLKPQAAIAFPFKG